MDCSEAKSHLSAFASGLTNDLDRTEIEEHLTSCEACSLEVELLRGRAAGQPAAAKPSDWTLEKIFGNEANGEAAAGSPAPDDSAPIEHDARELDTTPSDAAPAPAPAATPPTAHPSLILPPPPMPASSEESPDAKPAASKSRSKSGSWDFEPADAGKEAAPPEESLAFAEQALNRKHNGSSKSKAAAMRMLVWSLGGVAGLGLLGVSVWIALAVHQAPTREIATGAARSAPSTEAPTSGGVEGVEAPSETSPEHPIQAKSLPGLPVSPAAPTPANPSAVAPAPAATTPAQTTAAPGTSATTPAPSVTPAAQAPKSVPTATKPARDTAAPKKVAVASAAPAKPVKRDDDDMWPTDDPVRAGSASTGTKSPKPPAAGATTAPEPSRATAPPPAPAPKADVDVAPQATVAPPSSDAAPPSAAPPKGDAAAPSAPLSAIDRLHLATEKASEARDLTSLRQLKTAWKTLLRTTVGRDRSRTKREYADCLWEMQGLTGRDADRLECLNAYRDYLLSAPAGGTDTRSAERLRQLEDALHEGD